MNKAAPQSRDIEPPLQDRQIARDKPESLGRTKILSAIVAAILVLSAIITFTAASNPGNKDYIAYWTSAQLLLHHANPYSPSLVFSLERAQGHLAPTPLIMRNPPWALFLVTPLGLCNARVGLFLWTLLGIASIVVSIRILRSVPRDGPFAFLFAPVIACIYSGQSSPLLLLGFAFFLRFHRTRSFLAGCALLLMAIKPHLFLVFWAILLIDCVYQRTYRLLAGAALSLAAGSAFATLLDPRVWSQYLAMLRASSLDTEFFPTLSMQLRLYIAPHMNSLLFLPSAIAMLWGLWYYTRNRRSWDWNAHGMLVMLVTVVASPYGWFTDEAVLLPSIAFALTHSHIRRTSFSILLGLNAAALYLVIGQHASLSSAAYIWTPLAWLLWFICATRWPQLHRNDISRELTIKADA